jgi:hypothetical protein
MIPWLRFAPYIGGLVAIALALSYVHHKGVVSGRADIQAKFDAYVSAQEALVLKAYREADAKEAAAKIANDKALSDYRTQLSDSQHYASTLAAKLRDAIAKASSSPVPAHTDQPGTVTPGTEAGAPDLAGAVGNAISECRDNSAQLDALIAELKPQL